MKNEYLKIDTLPLKGKDTVIFLVLIHFIYTLSQKKCFKMQSTFLLLYQKKLETKILFFVSINERYHTRSLKIMVLIKT